MDLTRLDQLLAQLSVCLRCRAVTVCLFDGCLTSQQHACVSQGRIYSDNCTCCHTEIEVADQPFYLTQSQYTDTGPSQSQLADPITPGAWQGSHWSANFEVTGMIRQEKKKRRKNKNKNRRKRDSNSGPSAFGADALTTWPTRRWQLQILVGCRTCCHRLLFRFCSQPSNRSGNARSVSGILA